MMTHARTVNPYARKACPDAPTQVNFSFPEENQLGDVNEGNTDVYGEDGDPKIPKPGGAGCCFVEDPDNFDCMVTFWL